MLVLPRPRECLADLLFTLLATRFPHGCQGLWISHTCQDGTDNRLSGDARDITHDLGELHIHLQKSLVHVLNMRSAMLHQLAGMTKQRAQGHQFYLGAKGGF